MPSLVAPFDVYPALRYQSASRLADPNTGTLVARAFGAVVATSGSVVAVGKHFELPGDAIAVNCYATIDVEFDAGAWAGFLGYGRASASSIIELHDPTTGVTRTTGQMLARVEAWVGSYTAPRQVRTIRHRISANWGAPRGVPSSWEVNVYLACFTDAVGVAGGWANASTRVRNIDFEVLWPA